MWVKKQQGGACSANKLQSRCSAFVVKSMPVSHTRFIILNNPKVVLSCGVKPLLESLH